MTDEGIFFELGFDKSLELAFARLCKFIESADGCNGYVYMTPKKTHARGAHIRPGAQGNKKAQQVFVMINKRKGAILLMRRRRFRADRPKDQWAIRIDSNFSDWPRFERTIKEWSFDPKEPKKPRVRRDFGDGVALPGGRPESNRSKF